MSDKQDFNYDEKGFVVDDKSKNSISIDEIIDDNIDTEVSTDLKKKLVIIITIVVLSIIVIIVIVFLLRGKFPKSDDNETTSIEEEITFEEPVFEYTSEEKDKLRIVVYTASEIESFEEQEISDINSLIKEIEEKRRNNF